ncbi:MAG: GNAT family N-acetyltransferase [Deltaproteobacteria bacterium]|nr:GNAT family N-acetyltransferase [Deltaproteobacteria bacterium]
MILQKLPKELVRQRHVLLQDALRPEFHDYPIEKEYPILLSQAAGNYSYCAYERCRDSGRLQLLSHASFWPRSLICRDSGSRIPVALVGNVATSPEARGRGIMRNLMNFLWDQAVLQKLTALILWSDLHQFYEKLGFSMEGRELRITYVPGSITLPASPGRQLRHHPTEEISPSFLSRLLEVRYQTGVSIERSLREFGELLRIPDTHLLSLSAEGGDLLAYVILGKGYDMPGVIHEWGAVSPHILLIMIRELLSLAELPEIMLLSPPLHGVWKKELFAYAAEIREHHLALIRSDDLTFREKIFSQSFIWGLDTI